MTCRALTAKEVVSHNSPFRHECDVLNNSREPYLAMHLLNRAIEELALLEVNIWIIISESILVDRVF